MEEICKKKVIGGANNPWNICRPKNIPITVIILPIEYMKNTLLKTVPLSFPVIWWKASTV